MAEQDIVNQVEYYFSDRNYPRDKFMQGKAAEDGEGWIGLDVMMTFNRLKTLCDDQAKVTEALTTYKGDIFQLNEDKTKIRRNPEKPVEDQAEMNKRTVHTKGWPLSGTTIDTIKKFCQALNKNVESVALKRFRASQAFKGSAFIQFSSEEEAQQFSKEEHSVEGNPLRIEMRADYFQRKADERKAQKPQDSGENKQQKPQTEIQFNPGCVLKLFGFKNAETKREDIKETLNQCGTIEWVDFNKGEPEALVRFGSSDELKKAVEFLGSDKINGEDLSCSVLEGDEEKEYYLNVQAVRKQTRRAKQNGRKHSRGRFGGGQGGGKRRGASAGGDNPTKRPKLEE